MKKKLSTLSMAALAAVYPAFAQGDVTAQGIITQTEGQVRGFASSFVNLVLVLIGLIGIVFIAINLIKYFKGEHDSDNSLLKIGFGLLIGAILVAVIKAIFLGGV